ncbi:hypothetical protein ACWDSD_43495 [Streptomyces spiralis]
MKMRHAMTASLAAAVLGGLMTFTASPASAATPPDGIVWDHVWSAPGVTVYVEEHGDYVSVCDSDANGDSATATVWEVNGTVLYEQYTITVTSGAGSCVTRAASDGGVYDLTEGSTAKFQIGFRGDSSYSMDYETWVNDH